MTRVVLVPGVLALLPEYAGLEDPVADLRSACLEAVRWLGSDVSVLADEQGMRVARALLDAVGGLEAQALTAVAPRPPSSVLEVRGAPATSLETAGSVLVVGNGSAKRTERAPGHLDERSHAFDEALGASLRAGRPEVDLDLARELWASVDAVADLALLGDLGEATVDYDDDPYGVQYWVMRWQT